MNRITEKRKRWILLWRPRGKGKWKQMYIGDNHYTKKLLISSYYSFASDYYNDVKSGIVKAVRATVTTEWESPGVQP